MFDKDGKLDKRSRRILSEQTIPPRYGKSPGQDFWPLSIADDEIVWYEEAAPFSNDMVQHPPTATKVTPSAQRSSAGTQSAGPAHNPSRRP